MNITKFIGIQLIFFSLLIGVGYYYTISNPLRLFDGKTIQSWKLIASEVEIKQPGTIMTWIDDGWGRKGRTRIMEEKFNFALFCKILIYGLSLDLLVSGTFIFVHKTKKT